MPARYVERYADSIIPRLMESLPALLVVGPRATGKTTTARRYCRSVARLDEPAEAAAFEADPDAALHVLQTPVLLDEWQAVPGVLGAVKRAVDDDPEPGRFLLTGSVRADLEVETWPGTGRVVRVPMFGLTMRELSGQTAGTTFIERLVASPEPHFSPLASPPDLAGYVEIALAGGFPEPLVGSAVKERTLWLESYLDQLLTRDAASASGHDPARMRRYFEGLALSSAGLAAHNTLFEAAGINRKTADAYQRPLVNLMVLELVPAWLNSRLARLVKSPKRYVIDPSLIGAALRLDGAAVLRDGDLLGRLLDTLVVAQLRPELALGPTRPRLHHAREMNGRRELDLLVELSATQVVAFEVKATASPGPGDARHLAWMRDRLQARFVAGAVLHTGPRQYSLGPRLLALPIAGIWAGG